MENDTFARFQNRQEAGQMLANKLRVYAGQMSVVYALPRGGVEIGVEIAKRLQAPLDLVIPRKIGHPVDPEYAIGAVAESGKIVGAIGPLTSVDQTWLKEAIQHELTEAARRRQRFTGGRPAVDVKDKIAIIADDGVATGLTMHAAILDVRTRAPAKIIIAVPVIPHEVKAALELQVDRVVALLSPTTAFNSIGEYYDSFEQVEDEAVIALLRHYYAKYKS